MNGDAMASTAYFVLMLVLVASGFAARRVPVGRTVKMALGWVAIFAAGMLLYTMFDRSTPDAALPTTNMALAGTSSSPLTRNRAPVLHNAYYQTWMQT